MSKLSQPTMVRLTVAERYRLNVKALEERRTVSSVIRNIILDYFEKETPVNGVVEKTTTKLVPARRAPSGDPICMTVTVDKAADILGISRATAFTYARDGSLPTIRLGKRLLVPKAALEKLLSK